MEDQLGSRTGSALHLLKSSRPASRDELGAPGSKGWGAAYNVQQGREAHIDRLLQRTSSGSSPAPHPPSDSGSRGSTNSPAQKAGLAHAGGASPNAGGSRPSTSDIMHRSPQLSTASPYIQPPRVSHTSHGRTPQSSMGLGGGGTPPQSRSGAPGSYKAPLAPRTSDSRPGTSNQAQGSRPSTSSSQGLPAGASPHPAPLPYQAGRMLQAYGVDPRGVMAQVMSRGSMGSRAGGRAADSYQQPLSPRTGAGQRQSSGSGRDGGVQRQTAAAAPAARAAHASIPVVVTAGAVVVSRLEGESLGGSAHTSSSDSDSDIDGDHMLGPLSPCAESPRPWQQGGKGCVDTRASGEGVLSMPPPVLGAAGGGGGMGGSRPVSGRPSSGRPGSGRPGSAARGAPMAAASGAQQPAFGVRAVHPELRLGRTLSMSMTYEDIPVEDLSEGEPDCMEGVSEESGEALDPSFQGLTLDQYMLRLVTTPASVAATSGLGQRFPGATSAGRGYPGNDDDDVPLEDMPPETQPHPGAAQHRTPLVHGFVDPASPAPRIPPSPSFPRGGGLTAVGAAAAGAVGATARPPSGQLRSPSGQVPALQGAGAVWRGGSGAPAHGLGSGRTWGGVGPLHAGSSDGSDGDGEVADDEDEEEGGIMAGGARGRRRGLHPASTAAALSNSFDLRPATAAAPTTSSLVFEGSSAFLVATPGGRGPGRLAALDDSGAGGLIKEVDLGGMSAALFTPSPAQQQAADESGEMSSPSRTARIASAARAGRGPNSGSLSPAPRVAVAAVNVNVDGDGDEGDAGGLHSPGGPSTSGSPSLIISPSSSSCTECAYPDGLPPPNAHHAPHAPHSPTSRMMPRGPSSDPRSLLPSAHPSSRPASGVGGGPGQAQAQGGAASATSVSMWASRIASAKQGIRQALQVSAAVNTARPQGAPPGGTRMVQSARPFDRDGPEIDPTVWREKISVQLQRPPSRQRPPPEALHLWSPAEHRWRPGQPGSGVQGGHGSGPRARPHTAMATTTPARRPTSGPSVRAVPPAGMVDPRQAGGARPPSRQKPPPLSLLLEQPDEFEPALGAQGAAGGVAGGGGGRAGRGGALPSPHGAPAASPKPTGPSPRNAGLMSRGTLYAGLGDTLPPVRESSGAVGEEEGFFGGGQGPLDDSDSDA